MSRVLLAMIEPPLPFGHASARWFHVLLRGLVARGHRVTAFATCSRPDDVARAQAAFPAPAYDLRCYPHPARGGVRAKVATLARPFSYMFSDALRADLRRELERGFDVLHLEQLWSAWLGLEHVDRALVNVHHLYAVDLSLSPARGLRARALRALQLRAERRLVRAYPRLLAVSPRLVREVLALHPGASVDFCPIGLDLSLYPRLAATGAEPVVSLVGNMGWHPSRSAAERLLERLWPRIRDRVPAARLEVVGWGARRALGRFAGLPGVSLHEDVPDVRPYYERAAVFVYAPPRGSGMKIKVLESLAWGIPVVTNEDGAEGLGARDGEGLLLADDDDGLVERAVRVLQDAALRARLRDEGRALVERACAPDAALDVVERAYARG